MKGHKPAGGLGSNKVVTPGQKLGRAAGEKRPAGVSQIGSNIGDHSTEHSKVLKSGVEDIRGSLTPISGELGNSIAERTECKAGGSRKIMPSGGQGCH
jgi:hypothetical protein